MGVGIVAAAFHASTSPAGLGTAWAHHLAQTILTLTAVAVFATLVLFFHRLCRRP